MIYKIIRIPFFLEKSTPPGEWNIISLESTSAIITGSLKTRKFEIKMWLLLLFDKIVVVIVEISFNLAIRTADNSSFRSVFTDKREYLRRKPRSILRKTVFTNDDRARLD